MPCHLSYDTQSCSGYNRGCVYALHLKLHAVRHIYSMIVTGHTAQPATVWLDLVGTHLWNMFCFCEQLWPGLRDDLETSFLGDFQHIIITSDTSDVPSPCTSPIIGLGNDCACTCSSLCFLTCCQLRRRTWMPLLWLPEIASIISNYPKVPANKVCIAKCKETLKVAMQPRYACKVRQCLYLSGSL